MNDSQTERNEMHVNEAEPWAHAGLDPFDFAPISEVVLVTAHREALEVLRSAQFKSGFGTRSAHAYVDEEGSPHLAARQQERTCPSHSVPDTVPWERLLVSDGELLRSSGAHHTQRRRVMNRLFGGDAHIWYRDKVILPTLKRNLDAVLSNPGPDGIARVDMVDFASRLFAQFAATLIGLDGIGTRSGFERLMKLPRALGDRQRWLSLRSDSARERMMRRTLAAKAEFDRRFYAPSLARRRRLLALHRAGQLAESELPNDFLMLIAKDAATFGDPNAGLEQTIVLLRGAIGSSSVVLIHTIACLESWFLEHPEDAPLRTDPAFLDAALREAIRLHGDGFEALSRIALEDVTLSSGKQIKKGQYVAPLARAINTDTSVFGADADRFNPTRQVPTGIYPWGLGFGSGAHMCIALPLVLGEGGNTGTSVPTLLTLYKAGLRLDKDRPSALAHDPHHDEFASFPVVFVNDSQRQFPRVP